MAEVTGLVAWLNEHIVLTAAWNCDTSPWAGWLNEHTVLTG